MEPFSGCFAPRKAFTEKIARGLRRGRSPISRKSVHGKPFQGLRPRKACMEKGQINYLTRMCMRDMRSISLGRELGAIAPSDSPGGYRKGGVLAPLGR